MFNAVDSEGNVELMYDQSYGGFFEVKYDANASMMDENLCEMTGITDYFPPSDGSIVYRSFQTLKNYLASNVNVNLLMTPAFSFKDPFKQLLWDLGQVAVKCKTKGIELDTRMDRIFVAGNGSPRIKAIACIVEDGTNKWLDNLVALYNGMKNACHDHYDEKDRTDDEKFLNFLNLLKNSSSLRAVQTMFKSHYLWSNYIKFCLLNKLDDMIDCHKTMFVKVVTKDLPLLLTWRNEMSSDPHIGPLYAKSLKFLKNPPSSHMTVDIYNAKEIDIMLKFLRSNICHFRKLVLGQTIFNDEFELVEYYDTAFPKIMTTIYKGCKAMKNAKTYQFDVI